MRRDLLTGLLWFLGLFAFDAGSSVFELSKAMEGVKADPDTVWVVRQQVAIYAGQMLAAYLLMGLGAALFLGLLRRALPQTRPARTRASVIVLVSGWLLARGIVLWPMMYFGTPRREWIVSHITPGQITGTFLLLGAILLLRVLRGARPAWLLGALAVAGLCSVADGRLPARVARKNNGPNIIFIGFDALRPDHLASGGYDRDTAPNLDKFLARATVYSNAFTPEARTWEAWMSILSGAYPATHGQRWSLPAPDDSRPDVPMLTDILKEQGYYTSFLTDDSRFSYMLPEHNFSHIEQPPPGILNIITSRYQPNFRAFFTFLHGPLGWAIAPVYRYNQAFGITHRPELFAEHIADAISDAAEHDRFFLAVHSCLLHTPADRPYPYYNMYGMADYRGGNRYRYRSTGSRMADGAGEAEASPEDRALERLESHSAQQNLDLYDSGIAMVDLTWARVARALDDSGLWDNTLVVVLSDHGEDFLEEDMRYRFRGPNHGFHPWGTGQSRVLMALAGQGFGADKRDEPVSLIDLAPTAARVAGVPLSFAEGVPLQDPLPERYLYGETGVGESTYWPEGHRTTPFKYVAQRYAVDPTTGRVFQRHEYDEPTVLAKDRWVFDGTYWLVEEAMLAGGRYSLFRWREDPHMNQNLAGSERKELLRLRAAMRARPRFPGVADPVDDGSAEPESGAATTPALLQ